MAIFKLTVNKKFTYRGDATEEFSNSYLFSGASPADAAGWLSWANKIRDLEKAMLPATVTFVDWYGYEAGSWEAKPTSFDFHDVYAAGTVGTLATGGAPQAPGDAAFQIRFDTGQFTTKGKKIYLRKYFHAALISTGDPDSLLAAQKTAAGTYAAAMYSGTGLIGTARLARKTGTLVIGHKVGDFVTTRTLKRRGKRNPT